MKAPNYMRSELKEGMDLGGGAPGVHVFEAASLGNLMPATADEAKSLIPSLKRFDDEDVTKMCQIVQRCLSTSSLISSLRPCSYWSRAPEASSHLFQQ